MINYSIATNFDDKLIQGMVKLNSQFKNGRVAEIFGCLSQSLTGSGRSSVGLTNISLVDLQKHIQLAHKHHIKFNYLMNSIFLPKMKNKVWLKKLDRFVLQLIKAGVDSVTVANKDLAKYLRQQFPNLKLHVSLIAGVESVKEAKNWDKIGVAQITLNQHSLNRDLALIKRIRQAVKCKIQLYANISCLADCPLRQKHYQWLNQQSTLSNKSQQKIDRFILHCENIYLKNPINLLRSPFIRPEGIKLYTKIGICNFKLSDRRDPTNFLIKLATAYLRGSFSGNLFNLLFRDGRKWSNAVRAVADVKKIGQPNIIIDNSKLTALDFDRQVTTIRNKDLMNYYQLATKASVRGLTNYRTREFHNKLNSII